MSKIKSQSKAKFSTVHERMIRAVVNFTLSAENSTTTQSVVAFYALTLVVKDKLSAIDNLRSLAARPITGYAAQTKTLKATLSQTSCTIMQSVYAYALQESNEVLANSMLTTRSSLMHTKNVALVQYIQSAVNEVKPLVENLKDYNVTAEAVSNWKTLCQEFNNAISNPKNAISNRKSINNDIQRLLRESMNIIYNECDKLALQFADVNINYYDAYCANRKLNPGRMSTQLRLWVTGEQGAAITTGEVFILGTDRSATLNNEGYALVDAIPCGTHSISLTTPTGTFTYGPFDFKKGKSRTEHIHINSVSTDSRTKSSAIIKTTVEK